MPFVGIFVTSGPTVWSDGNVGMGWGGRWVQFVCGGGQMLVQVAKMPDVYASRWLVGLRLR